MIHIANVLRRARHGIRRPSQWTQAVEARDREGGQCGATSSRAVCFCANGALRRGDRSQMLVTQAREYLCKAAGVACNYPSLAAWNDAPERTHDEVLAAFDLAIEMVP